MSSQARLENVLRDIHVMISKSEVYDTDRIIVSKQDIFNLIDRLNASIYEIMDEYELTQQSRDRAIREKKRKAIRLSGMPAVRRRISMRHRSYTPKRRSTI